MVQLFSPNGSHLKQTSKQIAQTPAYMHYMKLPFQKDLFFFFFFSFDLCMYIFSLILQALFCSYQLSNRLVWLIVFCFLFLLMLLSTFSSKRNIFYLNIFCYRRWIHIPFHSCGVCDFESRRVVVCTVILSTFHDLWSFNPYSAENQVSSSRSSSWSIRFSRIKPRQVSWGCSPSGFTDCETGNNLVNFIYLEGANALCLEKDNWPNTHYHLSGNNSLGLLLSNFCCLCYSTRNFVVFPWVICILHNTTPVIVCFAWTELHLVGKWLFTIYMLFILKYGQVHNTLLVLSFCVYCVKEVGGN